jgi:stage V sporulation protein G
LEITEVRIKLMEGTEDRLRGFCSITFDHCFVVRDLKIIQGNNGPFVAMPSRKLTSNCPKCRTKNHLRANFCNQCGFELKNVPLLYDPSGRAKLYADIAHPVNPRCREMIQRRIVDELNREIELAGQPGYRSRYDDEYDDDFDLVDFSEVSKSKSVSNSEPDFAGDGVANPAVDLNIEQAVNDAQGQVNRRRDDADPKLPDPHESGNDVSSAHTPDDNQFGRAF